MDIGVILVDIFGSLVKSLILLTVTYKIKSWNYFYSYTALKILNDTIKDKYIICN